jgi:translation initiation factor 3 subunit I
MAEKIAQDKMKPISLRGHEKPIQVIKFNFDGDLFFSGAAERKINLWTAYTGERIGSYECEGAVRSLDVTVDTEYMVAGTLVGNVEFFKVENGRHVGRLSFEAKILTTEFSYGDGQLLVLLDWYSKDKSGTNSLFIYDFTKIKTQLAQNLKSDDKSIKVVVEPKQFTFKYKLTMAKWGFLNKSIIVATEDGSLQTLNLSGEVINKVKVTDDGSSVRSINITRDHSLLVACHSQGVKIYDPKTLEKKKDIRTEVPMNTGTISPLLFEQEEKNRKYQAIIGGGVAARDAAKHKMGGFDIRLVNLIYEEELGNIAGHFGPVNTLAFHKDGRGFVSGGEEGIIRIFRFPPKYFNEIDKNESK